MRTKEHMQNLWGVDPLSAEDVYQAMMSVLESMAQEISVLQSKVDALEKADYEPHRSGEP